MNIRGSIYRAVMKLSHKFNWHYAPPIYPDGDTLYLCKWCGMSCVMKRRDYKPIISTGTQVGASK